ncbi:MAG: DUF1565 domain-containing protein, partial [Planctomycetota bacterium]
MPRIPSATVAGLCLSLALLAAPGLRGADLLVPAEHPTIQAAIIAAQFGDTILVSPGTYTETIDFLGKGVSVASTGGASVTIIDGGQQQTSVVSFSSGEGPASVIEGFTIRNGLGTFIPAAQRLVGGGVYCGGTSPVIRNNIIMSNQATNGGGICCLDSFAEITGNLIEGNFASDGGGIPNNDSSPTVSGNTIRLNSAFGSGGGVYCFGSAPLIGENLIDSNSATAGGGSTAVNPHPRSAATRSAATRRWQGG